MRKNYELKSSEPYRISRTKIGLFLECPRCFYLDRRLGVMRPSGPGFSLNNAVDELLKKEFDIHRAKNTAHPLMKSYGIDAVPFMHEKMEEWRDARTRGITYLHKPTNLLVTGGIDDIWKTKKEELLIVDYKATSTTKKISLEDEYKQAYKKQIEVYQWLFRGNGFKVGKTGYFVYCNAKTDREAFDGKLEFDIELIAHSGDTRWIEPTLFEIKKTLNSKKLPNSSENCEYCKYRKSAEKFEH